jgi:hypothetical protein
MDLASVCELCLSFPLVEDALPFGPETLVFKVAGKVFALTAPEEYPPRMNLKCDPDRAVTLREEYDGIIPGWHMNKKHWNTVRLDGSVPSAVVRELVRHSYDLVVAGIPASKRRALGLE